MGLPNSSLPDGSSLWNILYLPLRYFSLWPHLSIQNGRIDSSVALYTIYRQFSWKPGLCFDVLRFVFVYNFSFFHTIFVLLWPGTSLSLPFRHGWTVWVRGLLSFIKTNNFFRKNTWSSKEMQKYILLFNMQFNLVRYPMYAN